ncbi:MAG: hypothetical protein ACYS99_14945, partial [Planctomycetota bacterium]
MRRLLLGLALLAVGLVAGYLLGRGAGAGPGTGDVESAKEALEALLDYRGRGARAVRESLSLVDRIVEGGREMVPLLRKPIEEGANWNYRFGAYSADYDAGVISHLPDLRTALLDAVSRLGGDEAVEVLLKAAEARGDWKHRVTAQLFLARRGDREDVRNAFTRLMMKYLAVVKDDIEMGQTLKATRGHLDPAIFPRMAAAFSSGLYKRGGTDEMAETLAGIDRRKAGELFLAQLANRSQPLVARSGAALACGRMPEMRQGAAALIEKDTDLRIAKAFVNGLRYGRYGGLKLQRAAQESRDPAQLREFNELRLSDLESGERLLRELAVSLGEEKA